MILNQIANKFVSIAGNFCDGPVVKIHRPFHRKIILEGSDEGDDCMARSLRFPQIQETLPAPVAGNRVLGKNSDGRDGVGPASVELPAFELALVENEVLAHGAVLRALAMESSGCELSFVALARNQRVLLQLLADFEDRQRVFVEVKRAVAIRRIANDAPFVLFRSVEVEHRAMLRPEIAEGAREDLAPVLVQRALALSVLLRDALDIRHVRRAMDHRELADRRVLGERAAENAGLLVNHPEPIALDEHAARELAGLHYLALRVHDVALAVRLAVDLIANVDRVVAGVLQHHDVVPVLRLRIAEENAPARVGIRG